MFGSFPLWLNIIIFIISAGIIWLAGTYLEYLSDIISIRTGLGHAFTGVLLLSVSTSLPEVVTTFTAIVFLNNPTLAVYNILGGVAFQTVILVIADALKKDKGALTFFSPRFALLIEGTGLLILLQIVIAGISTRGTPLLGTISIWTILLFLSYLLMMYLTYQNEGHPRWKPTDKDELPAKEGSQKEKNQYSTKRLWSFFAGASAVVLVAGWGAAQSADVLAKETGLGSAFLGATLLAAATSMPELSTTITASKNRNYSMGISNIIGSNAFMISLLFFAELLYTKDTIIKEAQESVLFITSIGAIMTCIYLMGLMERQNKTIWRVGWDSAACLVIYLGSIVILYFMS